MSQHYLSSLFSPSSVAVFGASPRPESVGGVVYRNLLATFQGKVYPINPKRKTLRGNPVFAGIEELPEPVDMAVVATPAPTIPGIVEACGKAGVKSMIIYSAGFAEAGAKGMALQKRVVDTARAYGIRLLGPNCLGVIRPATGFNATFYKGTALHGRLALVSQSGALCTAVLDWAEGQKVGFSSIVSLGVSADIDFGEILDYLVSDIQTDSILLYVEGVREARGFVSALRAAARMKPVIVVKVGRHRAGLKAAVSHTGALVGGDDVFDAALARAGVVRVSTVSQLFTAASALASAKRPTGNRLAIVTNGGGPGAMAADRVADLPIAMADLGQGTLDRLNEVLPGTWSHGNPVDIIGDAPPERYRAAVEACLADEGVDGVLTILTPQAMTEPGACADAVIEVAASSKKPVLACWMGDVQTRKGRHSFVKARIPSFRTPEPAVDAFSFVAAYYQNQKLLMQTPGPLAQLNPPDAEGARMLIESALGERRQVLSEMESKALLAAFHIPVASTMIAHSPNEALLMAEQLGFPIALKINSPDITHKSDAGGVKLNLTNAHAVRAGYHEIIEEVTRNRPGAHIDGVAVEPMAVKPNGRELMIGVITDPVFGPVITFGGGGVSVEVMGDRAVSLPPLNRFLVRDMISRTKVARLLKAFRHMPPVNMDALEELLLRVSEMVCELPWLKEMDINPVIADENGVLAVDARIVVEQRSLPPGKYAHMAIYPYPAHLATNWQMADGTDVMIRPIRPEDAELEQDFVRHLSDEAKYFRFMNNVVELSQTMLVRFTQIDYDREMALVAVIEKDGGELEVGVCRYAINPDGASCEFATVVADDWQRRGIGTKMMNLLMDAARTKGLRTMEGEVLAANKKMLKFVQGLGFSVEESQEDSAIKKVAKKL